MSDDIRIAVDASGAESGIKTLESCLKSAISTLSAFDAKAKSAFAQLDRSTSGVTFSRLSTEAAAFGNATRNMASGMAGATRNLDAFSSRATRAFTNVARSLSGLNFQKVSAEVTRFTYTLSAMGGNVERVAGHLRTVATAAQAAQRALNVNVNAGGRNYAVLGRQLGGFAVQLQKLAGVSVSSTLARNIGTLGQALGSLRVPSAAVVARLGPMFRAISTAKIPTGLAGGMTALSGAMANFRTVSAAQVKNLQSLLTALGTVNAAQIRAVANALRPLNGLNVNIPAGAGRNLQRMANVNAGGAGGGGAIRNPFNISGITGATGALRGLENAFSATYQASTMFRVALGSLTLGSAIKSIFELGTGMMRFDRQIESIATSMDEVSSHKAFINTLTNELPISLDVAQRSFGKFAVSARLSGVSMKDAQELYKAMSVAFTVNKVSPQGQENAFLALEEMFNKGTIQSKELRRQLSQYIPGAYELFAQSVKNPDTGKQGVSTAKLGKMMEGGEVKATELIQFGKVLMDVYGGQIPKALLASISQMTFLQTTVQHFQRTVYENGFDRGLAAMFANLTEAMKSDDIDAMAKRIGAGFQDLFVNLGALGSMALANWEPITKVVTAIAGFAMLSGSVAVLRMLFSPLALLFVITKALWSPVLALGLGLVRLGAMAFTAATGVQVFGITTAVATSPIWVAVAGIIALGAALGALLTFKSWDDFSETMKGIGSTVLHTMQTVLAPIAKSITASVTPDLSGISKSFDAERAKMTKNMAGENALLNTIDPKTLDRNLARQNQTQRTAEQDIELSKKRQQLLDQADPIGKANDHHIEQLKVINQLVQRGLGYRADGTKSLDGGPLPVHFTEAQGKEMTARLNRQDLDKMNPFAGEIKGMEDEIKVLSHLGAERQIEQKMLAITNKLRKEGQTVDDEMTASLRNMLLAMRDLEEGGANGFQRWIHSTKDLREALIDVEKNGVDTLSNALADLSVGKVPNFLQLVQSIIRPFNKAMIDEVMKGAFKDFKGNSPLASLFGLKAPDPAAALTKAQAVAATETKKLATRSNFTEDMAVSANNVFINGKSAGLPNDAIPQAPFSGKSSIPGAIGSNGLTPTGAQPNSMLSPTLASTVGGGHTGETISPHALSVGAQNQELLPSASDWPKTATAAAEATPAATAGAASPAAAASVASPAAAAASPGFWATAGQWARRKVTPLDWLGGGNFLGPMEGSSAAQIVGAQSPGTVASPTNSYVAPLSSAPFSAPTPAAQQPNALIRKQLDADLTKGMKPFSMPSFGGAQPASSPFAGGTPGSGNSAGWPAAAPSAATTIATPALAPAVKEEISSAVAAGAPAQLGGLSTPLPRAAPGAPSAFSGQVIPLPRAAPGVGSEKYKIGDSTFNSLSARANFMRPGQEFGQPGERLTQVTTDSHHFTVHPESASAFRGFVSDLEGQGAPLGGIGGYSERPAGIGGRGRMSQHSMGNAIDMGSQTGRDEINPATRGWIESHPTEWRAALNKRGMISGGDWKNPDLGHVEWSGKRPWLDQDHRGDWANPTGIRPPANIPPGPQSSLGGDVSQYATPLASSATFNNPMPQSAPQPLGGFSLPQNAGQNGLLSGATNMLQNVMGGAGMGGGMGGAQGAMGGIMQGFSLIKSIFGMFGSMKEGGFAMEPVSMLRVSHESFRNAPHYAEGTGRATRSPGTASLSGGFPTVLHDNEAVIPLTRGREVPVNLTTKDSSANQKGSGPNMVVNLHGVTDFDSFKRSDSQLRASMASASILASNRNN